MRIFRATRSGCLAALLAATAPANVSYTCSFLADDDQFSSTSAPVVSLFDSSGNLIVFDAGGFALGACGPRAVDPVAGYCLDAYINGFFPAGTYTAILTEWDNTPNGPTLADGFVEQGTGKFHRWPVPSQCGPGFQRTAKWALDVPGPATT